MTATLARIAGRLTGPVAVLCALLLGGPAGAQSRDPRVPPARDPGGIAVAIVGGGVDYTRPGLATRLARDGEGDIVGWDFADGDNRPFAPCVEPSGDVLSCSSAIAEAVIEETTAARLIIVRVDPLRPQTVVDAIRLVAQTPARVVLLAPGLAGSQPALLLEASARFPRLLFVTQSTGSEPRAAPTAAGNVIEADGEVPLAAARAAGQAVRALAAAPEIDAATLRRRVLGIE